MKQNLMFLTTFLLIVFPLTNLFAQLPDCEETKKENEYLKKALNIYTPINSATANKMDFNLQKCEGSIKEQTITLSLMIINRSANANMIMDNAVIVDIEGNEYKTSRVKIGSGNTHNKVYTDVPVKTTVIFERVLPTTKLLKLIAIGVFSGNHGNFEFKDIEVVWK